MYEATALIAVLACPHSRMTTRATSAIRRIRAHAARASTTGGTARAWYRGGSGNFGGLDFATKLGDGSTFGVILPWKYVVGAT